MCAPFPGLNSLWICVSMRWEKGGYASFKVMMSKPSLHFTSNMGGSWIWLAEVCHYLWWAFWNLGILCRIMSWAQINLNSGLKWGSHPTAIGYISLPGLSLSEAKVRLTNDRLTPPMGIFSYCFLGGEFSQKFQKGFGTSCRCEEPLIFQMLLNFNLHPWWPLPILSWVNGSCSSVFPNTCLTRSQLSSCGKNLVSLSTNNSSSNALDRTQWTIAGYLSKGISRSENSGELLGETLSLWCRCYFLK